MERCHVNFAREFPLQINEGKLYESAVIFLGEEFVRITESTPGKETVNTYYDWAGIGSIRTISPGE
jgi:hypothetical protein